MTSLSIEAEFIKLTPAGMIVKWLAGMLQEFGATQPTPEVVFTDSTNALTIVMNS
jgi:hypothetical protein